MPYDEVAAARVGELLGRRRGLTRKEMFGGIAFLLNGNMCVGLIRDELIARVGPDAYDAALFEDHVREFDFTGRPMRGWIVVEPEGIARDEQLRRWIDAAVTFVATLPEKSKPGESATRRGKKQK